MQSPLKKNWLRAILKGMSFSSAFFIFQCAYGMPQDIEDDILVEGSVTARATGLPIKNIHVYTEQFGIEAGTDEKGEFSFYTPIFDQIILSFEDIDSTFNGSYSSKDTLISSQLELTPGGRLKIDIILDEK